MKRARHGLFGLFLLVVAAAALAAPVLRPGIVNRVEFLNCAAAGSSSQTINDGDYLFRVTSEDTWVCWAATCASGGERFSMGYGMRMSFQTTTGTTTLSCRSTGSTGNATFTPTAPGT